MDKEIVGDKARYHLSQEEVDFLRSYRYGYYVTPPKPGTRDIRIIEKENTPSGKQSQRYLEEIIKNAGFKVNELPTPESPK